jgi:hypothetical protein
MAALQLASQKWDRIHVSGPQWFRHLVVELAAEQGFKVANPELQPALALARDRQKSRDIPRRNSDEPLPTVRNATEAFERHLEDVRRLRPLGTDPSRLDAIVAVRLKVTGHPRSAVERAVAEHRRRVDPGRQDWSEYARRVADYAFGSAAKKDLAEALDKRQRLLQLEGGRETPIEQRLRP